MIKRFTVETRGCLYEPEYTEELLQMEAEQAERNRGESSVETAFL